MEQRQLKSGNASDPADRSGVAVSERAPGSPDPQADIRDQVEVGRRIMRRRKAVLEALAK